MIQTLSNNLLAAASSQGETHSDSASYGQGAEAVEPNAVQTVLMYAVQGGIGVLVLAICLCLYRMIKGPHLSDRVLAGDVIAMLVAGLVILLSIKMGSTMYYDAAMVVAVVGFASTVAFAQYIGAKNKYADDPKPAADAGDAA